MDNYISKIRLSKDQLKLTAVILMIIDHAGYGLLHNYLSIYHMDILPQTFTKLNNVYEFSRGIGRIAFPIFCFFLVEGFIRTRNVSKYALRLFLFALISEIPFDLCLYRKLIYNEHQNVMFSLFLGIAMLATIKYLLDNGRSMSNALKIISTACAIAGFAELAQLLKVDYTYKGMLLIAALYLFRFTRPLQLIAGAAVNAWEAHGPIAFFLLYFYDPDIKPRLKYFFYAFYPIHLFLIYLIGSLLFR